MVVWIKKWGLCIKNGTYEVWKMSRYVVYIGREIMWREANMVVEGLIEGMY